MNTERIWVCWSFEQGCFHIEPEERGLQINLQAFVLNNPVSYVPIGVFDSHEAASEFCDRWREEANKRLEQIWATKEHTWSSQN